MKKITTLICMFLIFNCSVVEAKRPVYTTNTGGGSISRSSAEVAPPTYCTNTGGCGYRASKRAPYKFAAVAFAAVLVGLIIYVALQKESAKIVHAHSDSTSTSSN